MVVAETDSTDTVASRVPSAPSPDDDDDDAWTWSTTEIMIAGGKLKNSEKYLPELRHGNSAVLGSTTICRLRSSAVAMFVCKYSHKITRQLFCYA